MKFLKDIVILKGSLMPLYKYVTAERVDILKNGLIRFTQPAAFNDPFETFPCFTAGFTDECIQDFLSNHKLDRLEIEKILKSSFENEMAKYPGLKIPFEAIRDVPFIRAAINQANPMIANLFRESMSGSGAFFRRYTIKLALESINRQFGVLCLAEKPNNLLMWAHYAGSHSGFVLEFDEKHSYFDRRKKEGEIGRCLKKVRYTKFRPQTVIFDPRLEEDEFRNEWANKIFFSKSEHWSYEEEWRIVEYLRECDHIIRSESNHIYLYPIPLDCISGIIFGCRALDSTKSFIRNLVHANPACSKIRLWNAIVNEKEYNLHFSAVGVQRT